MHVSNNATLSGVFDIDLAAGFVPVQADLYDFVTWVARNGRFTAIVDLDPYFTPTYLADRLQLKVGKYLYLPFVTSAHQP